MDEPEIDPAELDETVDPADLDEAAESTELDADLADSGSEDDADLDEADLDDADLDGLNDLDEAIDLDETIDADLADTIGDSIDEDIDPFEDGIDEDIDSLDDVDPAADLDADEPAPVLDDAAPITAATGTAATVTAAAATSAASIASKKAGQAGRARRTDDDDDRDRGGLLGWIYLGVLAAVFLVVALMAAGADDVIPEIAAEDTATTVAVESTGTPTAIAFVVDGDAVTITGSVPDEGARTTLIDSATGRYSTVIDELVVDDGVTLVGGTATVSGTAFFGDDDAQGLLNDSANSLGLEAGAFDVEFIELDKTPTAAVAAVSTNLVTLTGSFPDQASIEQFTLAAAGVFGAENVDSSALVVDPDSTLTSSTITINGTIDAGDLRGQEFQTALGQFFGSSTVDGAGLSFDTSPAALGRLETRLTAQLATTPILFESGSAEISADSAAVLEQVAVAINAAPGINVEIVGHTDSSGDAGLNQVLSDDRANAVLARLVELGVDPTRLTARGAGEAEPIADNETDEGKAANRRIAFEFDGAVTAEEAAAAAEEAANADADDEATEEEE